MFEQRDKPFYKRLRDSMMQNDHRAFKWRNGRLRLIKKIAGKHATGDPHQKEDAINLLKQTQEIYSMSMAANRPRVLITSDNPALRGFSTTFQTGLNTLLRRSSIHVMFQKCIVDAFVGLAIVKTALGDHPSMAVDYNEIPNPGYPKTQRISFDDFGFDANSNRWSAIRYAWDRYQMPLHRILANAGKYDQEYAVKLAASDVPPKNESGEERVAEMATEQEPTSIELEPMVNLVDVWLPDRKQVWVCAWDHPELPPLAVIQWPGRATGPYQILRFGLISDVIMPSPPAAHLLRLHDLTNDLIRKGAEQACDQKTVNTYTASEETPANNIRKAKDGDWVKVKNPADVGTVQVAGVDGATQAFAIGAMDAFDRVAGNLQAMGGLGPQSGTLGQDQLIHAQVSKNEAHMITNVLMFITEVISDMAHLVWHDDHPLETTIAGTVTAAGTDWPVEDNFTPSKRIGSFEQYDLRVDPYSLPFKSPSQRLQALDASMQTFMEMDAAGVLAQHGGRIDVARYVEIKAELMDEPRLKEVVVFDAAPQPPLVKGNGEGGKMPKDTTRRYVRQNVSTGGTPESRHGTLQQALLSGSSSANNDQMAALSRPGAA